MSSAVASQGQDVEVHFVSDFEHPDQADLASDLNENEYFSSTLYTPGSIRDKQDKLGDQCRVITPWDNMTEAEEERMVPHNEIFKVSF